MPISEFRCQLSKFGSWDTGLENSVTGNLTYLLSPDSESFVGRNYRCQRTGQAHQCQKQMAN
ncbi:MAG TPA: hypothetical protein V6D28_13865 [Leptolyngbyaceae cyanobacterium]